MARAQLTSPPGSVPRSTGAVDETRGPGVAGGAVCAVASAGKTRSSSIVRMLNQRGVVIAASLAPLTAAPRLPGSARRQGAFITFTVALRPRQRRHALFLPATIPQQD